MGTARVERERIGIFGGTFDPIHIGHLVAAQSVLHRLGLDRVLMVVAGDPWMKAGNVVAPADARVEMVAAALEGIAGLEVSTLEVDRPGPTYTVDTVEALHTPDRDLVLIVGSDVVRSLGKWHRLEALQQLVTLGVVTRSGDEVPSAPRWSMERVVMPRIDISSSELRDRMARGEPVDFLIPAAAMHVIEKRHLYTPA